MFRPAGSRPARTSFHSAPRWRLPQLVVCPDHGRGRNRLARRDACPEPEGAGPRPCCCLVGFFPFFFFFKKKIKPVDLSCGCEGCVGIVGRQRCPAGSGSESEPFGGPPSPAGRQVVGPGSSLGVSLQPGWTSVLSVATGLPKAQQDPQRSPRARQCPVGQREDSLIAGPPPRFRGLCAPGSPEKTRTKQACAVNVYNQPENKHEKHHHGMEHRRQEAPRDGTGCGGAAAGAGSPIFWQ